MSVIDEEILVWDSVGGGVNALYEQMFSTECKK